MRLMVWIVASFNCETEFSKGQPSSRWKKVWDSDVLTLNCEKCILLKWLVER